MTLDEIAIKYGTDKATKHSHPHCYTTFYEKFFEPIRNESIKFLEIGVAGGESMQTWLDYFPEARVYGVDIVKDTNIWNTETINAVSHPRYRFVCGDQGNPNFWMEFLALYGSDWDVIMDDGCHFSQQINTSFNSLWSAVKPGGLYCIEDLRTGYDAMYLTPNWPTHMDLIRKIMDDINLKRNDVSELHCSNELAIIRKKGISNQ